MSNSNKKYECPCCGYYTLEEEPPGTFEICPVCYWEDDNIQYLDHEYEGGANDISLNQARKKYKLIGAISKKYLKSVRSPSSEEKDTNS
ncbi:CPCC family cysteine-rich protein [Candidatus Dependentiae bacterium]